MKTKEQLVEDCTNEHDRKLMIKAFDKFDKTNNKARIFMWIAIFFMILGVFGMLILDNDYFILSFIPVSPLVIISMIYNLKSIGLF